MTLSTTLSRPWPCGFQRILPGEAWTTAPIDNRAIRYNQVGLHGWYSNLDPTVEEILGLTKSGGVTFDFSGGTGLLEDRYLTQTQNGVAIVDASPAYLRYALEKFKDDERVAFRLLKKLEGQVWQRLDDVIDFPARVIASANAVHLYQDKDLLPIFQSWRARLEAGGYALIQSGNIQNPKMPDGHWLIDDTVRAIHQTAIEIVQEKERYAAYRSILTDPRLRQYDAYRERTFPQLRSLDSYTASLREAEFSDLAVRETSITVDVGEWCDFLSTYADAIVGWAGGADKVDKTQPSDEAIVHQQELMKLSLDRIFKGRSTFQGFWTYITCKS